MPLFPEFGLNFCFNLFSQSCLPPMVFMESETFLHGHLPKGRITTPLIIIALNYRSSHYYAQTHTSLSLHGYFQGPAYSAQQVSDKLRI